MGSSVTAFPPGGLDWPEKKTNVGETLMRRRRCCGVAVVNFQPKSTAQDEKIRTGQKHLREAQFWYSRLGYFSGGMDNARGRKTYDRQTLEPSAVLGRSPPLFDRRYFIIQAECSAIVAKSLSDVTISAESPGFSFCRNRLLGAEIDRRGRRRN